MCIECLGRFGESVGEKLCRVAIIHGSATVCSVHIMIRFCKAVAGRTYDLGDSGAAGCKVDL